MLLGISVTLKNVLRIIMTAASHVQADTNSTRLVQQNWAIHLAGRRPEIDAPTRCLPESPRKIKGNSCETQFPIY